MQTHEDAAQVLEQLDGTYTFDGMDTAMVLKWVDQDLQKRRRMEREGPPSGFGGELRSLHISCRSSLDVAGDRGRLSGNSDLPTWAS